MVRDDGISHVGIGNRLRGMTCREAGLAAGYKDGPGLKGNISRLRQTAVMREHIAEIAARSTELAEIYDGWILADMKLFARGTLANFFKRDDEGKVTVRSRPRG